MPVYFITVHTYRSWHEDNPRGYVQRGEPGVQPPNKQLAQHRNQSARHDAVRLNHRQMEITLQTLNEVATNLDVTPYAGSCTATHWHLLAGWINPSQSSIQEQTLQEVRSLATRLKRIIGAKLSADEGKTGLRWFSRGWHIERIEKQDHFDHLVESYLPKHLSEGGQFAIWKHG